MRGDARLLRQILVNLVGNAMKFTDQGEVVIRAESQPAAELQALVRFTVRDSGSGIPPDALATLFEPFTQVDGSSTRAHGGSGLGLAISARLVRLMGGKLTVDSELGRGSTFSFALPFMLPEEPVADAAADAHGASAARADRRLLGHLGRDRGAVPARLGHGHDARVGDGGRARALHRRAGVPSASTLRSSPPPARRRCPGAGARDAWTRRR